MMSANYVDMLTDAAIHIVRDHGMGGLTVRAVADWLGVRPPAVSQRTTRQQMLADVVALFCVRWSAWVRDRSRTEGVFALLPATDEDVAAVRVLLAVVEHARHDESAAAKVAEIAAGERAVLERCAEVTEPSDLEWVEALVNGLRAAVCAPQSPMSAERAREVLATRLGVPPPEPPTWPHPAWA